MEDTASPRITALWTAMDAFRSAIDAGRLDSANAQLIRTWASLLDHHAAEIRVLLADLPTDSLVQYPLLGLMLGFCCHVDPASRPRAARYLTLACQAARPRLAHGSVSERIAIHCAESAALRELGQMKGALSAARAAVRLLNVASDDHLAELEQLPRLYADLGWTFFEDGRSEEALVAFLRGLAAAEDRGEDGRGNLAALCAMQVLEGDIVAARDNLALARSRMSESRVDAPRARLHLALADALLELERFDAETAAAHMAALGPVRETSEAWIEMARMEAAIALVEGRAAQGLSALERFLRTRAPEGRGAYARRRLGPMRALLQLALGNVAAAGTLLGELGNATPQIRIGLARVDLARGRVHAALRTVTGLPVDGLSPRTLTEAAVVEAAVLLRLPDASRARGAVDRLGALARSTGVRLPLAFLPEGDFERVRAALCARGYDDLFDDARPLLADVCGMRLTPRETALVRALAQPDASRAAIAARLHVSVNTVKTQLRLLYRKLGVSDRESALAVAFERRLLDEDDEPAVVDVPEKGA